MKVSVLSADTALPGFGSEHGLSLFIEACGRRFLFDTGKSQLLTENAERMGIDPGTADFIVLSHGHSDHSGGIDAVLQKIRVPVYAGKGAFERHLSKIADGLVDISAVTGYRDLVEEVDGSHEISGGFLLFSCDVTEHPQPPSNIRLMTERDGVLVPDDFCHERNLLFEEDGLLVVITGCAHRGILNILDEAERICGRTPDVLIGGMHLTDPRGSGFDGDTAGELCRRMSDGMMIAGHCTGEAPISIMQDQMGDRFVRLDAGLEYGIRSSSDPAYR